MILIRFISQIFSVVGGKFIGLSGRIYTPPPAVLSTRELRAAPWFKVDGDKTLRLDYDNLTKKSVVFDVGGYEGQWANDIYSKYGCSVYIFEPVPRFAKVIRQRFKRNPDIQVYAFGLAATTRTESISLDADQSSVFKPSANTKEIKLQSITNFMKSNNIKFIDLVKINIEGGEYELIENLIDSGAIRAIRDLQVQFHDFDFIENAEKRMKKIQKNLSNTHRVTYQYPYIWENWRLKSGQSKKYE